jgi:hypothetical protein
MRRRNGMIGVYQINQQFLQKSQTKQYNHDTDDKKDHRYAIKCGPSQPVYKLL